MLLGDVARGCLAGQISDFLLLPELLASFGHLGYDVVEAVFSHCFEDTSQFTRAPVRWKIARGQRPVRRSEF